MPETSERRRILRGQIANNSRWGRPEQAARARTALAVEKAREQVEALGRLTPPADAAQVDTLVGAAERVRAWAREQAEQAPAIGPRAADAVAAALRGSERGAA